MSNAGVADRPESTYKIQPLIRNTTGLFLRSIERSVFGMRVDVDGLTNLTGLDEPAIIAVNHLSLADPFFDCVFMRRHVRDRETYIAAKDSLWLPGIGRLMEKFGAWPVDRSGSEAAKANFFRLGRYFLEERQAHQIIYPQGTRRDISTLKTKSGVTALSLATNAPIVPVGRYGTHEAYDPRKRLPVTVVIGEPIYPPESSAQTDSPAPSDRERTLAVSRQHAVFNTAFRAVCAQALGRYLELTGQSPAGEPVIETSADTLESPAPMTTL